MAALHDLPGVVEICRRERDWCLFWLCELKYRNIYIKSKKKKGLKQFGFRFDPPPFGQCPNMRIFFIASQSLLREVLKIIHILWSSVFPPPLSASAEVNNIHTQEFLYPHLLTPPSLPLSTFININ